MPSHTLRTPPQFNRAAKHFNELQAVIVPLNPSCISRGQSALNYRRKALTERFALLRGKKCGERLITGCFWGFAAALATLIHEVIAHNESYPDG